MSYGMNSGSGVSGNKIPSGYKSGQMQQFIPQQMKLFKHMFSGVSPDSYTSRLAQGDEELFDEMEQPALRQFGELQGNIASKFSGMGMGGRRSSGFQNTMTAASQDFASQLQSRRQELQRNAIKDLHGMSSDLLGQRPYDQFMTKKEQSSSPWASIAGTALGAGAGFFAGGPVGAMQGAQIGHSIGSSF